MMDLWHRERIEPLRHRLAHGVVREHQARYRFAAEILAGRVLDAGCGTGYGAMILSGGERVREVVGIDRDARAIGHARRYYRAGEIEFRCADLLDPRTRTERPFDGIACLEVLEHLGEPERLLETLHLLLAPEGRLIVSTPLGKGRAVPSSQPGHLFQLTREEFEGLLAPRFRFRLYGQKGEGIEAWRRGGRYFLMLACCTARPEGRPGGEIREA